MRIMFMTNEFPPHVYGGAGVHVEYLSKELKLAQLEFRSFHDQAITWRRTHRPWHRGGASQFAGCPVPLISPLRALATCLVQWAGIAADIVHCHTWYAHFGDSREVALRHPAGDHRTLVGAAAAMEARTDRSWVRSVELD